MEADSSELRVKPLRIGFPAPLLGPENHRVDVLLHDAPLLALDRPAGTAMNPHPWYPKVPALVDALRTQLRQGKPELLRLGLAPEAEPQSVFSMDPQIAGVALLSFGDAATEDARNAYGSQLYTLRFQFVATGGPDLDSIECELPLAQHFSRPYTIVSHQTGKRTLTRFRRLERLGRWNLWEALTQYYRPDQLAVHATEVGLRIPGETKYAHEPLLRLSQLKRGWRGDKETEPALYEGLAAWLSDLTLNDGRTLSAQPPPRLANMIRQLRKHG